MADLNEVVSNKKILKDGDLDTKKEMVIVNSGDSDSESDVDDDKKVEHFLGFGLASGDNDEDDDYDTEHDDEFEEDDDDDWDDEDEDERCKQKDRRRGALFKEVDGSAYGWSTTTVRFLGALFFAFLVIIMLKGLSLGIVDVFFMLILAVFLYIIFSSTTGSNLAGSLPFATYPNPPHLGLDGVNLANRYPFRYEGGLYD